MFDPPTSNSKMFFSLYLVAFSVILNHIRNVKNFC